jgi:FkbM family methyltransferase
VLTIYPEKQYPDAVEFCKLFICKQAVPRYVMGRNEYAASIAKLVDVNGFIDDFTSETEFLGKPIFKMTEIPRESMVVSAVIFVVPLSALRKLKSHGFACLDYFNFIKYSGIALKEIEFLRECKEDIKKNWDKYQWVYERLEDEKSKHELDRLLNFRFSSDLNYMIGFEHALGQQYFEDFFDLKPDEVFVDAGGFDGQTAIEFIKRCPDYKSIYIFEPDPDNLALARNNLLKHHSVYFYMMGLAESEKTLRFCSGEGSASKVCDTGDIEIRMDAIDNLIEEPISIIKMDIEGAEGIALEGARSHIKKNHPKLAICCYHKADDLWRIPEQIMAIRDDYSIYLRHYTDGLHETVMYFIPNA